MQSAVSFLGTQLMSNSLTFSWVWLGTKSYHGLDLQSQHNRLESLSGLVDAGKIKSHLTKQPRLTASVLRHVHRLIESSKTIGKIGLGVDADGSGEPFA